MAERITMYQDMEGEKDDDLYNLKNTNRSITVMLEMSLKVSRHEPESKWQKCRSNSKAVQTRTGA